MGMKIMYYEERTNPSSLWNFNFDGACNKDGNRVGVLFIYPQWKEFPHGFRIEFECRNNVAEYEAPILGLDTARKMGIRLLKIFGESDLIVNQVKDIY
jgi:ribonuclease HI|nr:hypothetical protein Q903MT_gene4437 [Picea sitchensis]